MVGGRDQGLLPGLRRVSDPHVGALCGPRPGRAAQPEAQRPATPALVDLQHARGDWPILVGSGRARATRRGGVACVAVPVDDRAPGRLRAGLRARHDRLLRARHASGGRGAAGLHVVDVDVCRPAPRRRRLDARWPHPIGRATRAGDVRRAHGPVLGRGARLLRLAAHLLVHVHSARNRPQARPRAFRPLRPRRRRRLAREREAARRVPRKGRHLPARVAPCVWLLLLGHRRFAAPQHGLYLRQPSPAQRHRQVRRPLFSARHGGPPPTPRRSSPPPTPRRTSPPPTPGRSSLPLRHLATSPPRLPCRPASSALRACAPLARASPLAPGACAHARRLRSRQVHLASGDIQPHPRQCHPARRRYVRRQLRQVAHPRPVLLARLPARPAHARGRRPGSVLQGTQPRSRAASGLRHGLDRELHADRRAEDGGRAAVHAPALAGAAAARDRHVHAL